MNDIKVMRHKKQELRIFCYKVPGLYVKWYRVDSGLRLVVNVYCNLG